MPSNPLKPTEPTGMPPDFEELLRRQMAIEPSPGFLPVVRRRIRAQPGPVVGHWRRYCVAGAVALAGIVMIAVMPFRSSPAPLPALPRSPQLASVNQIPSVRPQPLEVMSTGALHKRAPVSRRPAGRVRVGPGVLVDQRQRAALVTLIQMIDNGRLSEASFANTHPTSLEPIRNGVTALEVMPMTVSPIGRDGVLQKTR